MVVRSQHRVMGTGLTEGSLSWVRADLTLPYHLHPQQVCTFRGICASNQATVPTEKKLYVGKPRYLTESGALPGWLWACIQSTEAQVLCSTVTSLS